MMQPLYIEQSMVMVNDALLSQQLYQNAVCVLNRAQKQNWLVFNEVNTRLLRLYVDHLVCDLMLGRITDEHHIV